MTAWIGVLIGALGFALSVYNLYIGRFQAPQLICGLGPDVHLYYPSDGGSALYLPLKIVNVGARKTYVTNVALALKLPSGDVVLIPARREVDFDAAALTYGTHSPFLMFGIEAMDAVQKMFQFVWNVTGSQFNFEAGDYGLDLYAWTSHSDTPAVVVSEALSIGAAAEQQFIGRRETNDPRTLIFQLKFLFGGSRYPKDSFSDNIIWEILSHWRRIEAQPTQHSDFRSDSISM